MKTTERVAIVMTIVGILQLALSLSIVICAICACIFKALILVKITATLAVFLLSLNIAGLYAGIRFGENGEIE